MRERVIAVDELISEIRNCANIPRQFREYIQNVAKSRLKERWIPALLGPHGTSILQDIDVRFSRASRILNLSPAQIAKELDLDSNNITGNRMDSFIAELRALFWLDTLGLKNIRPLRATSKRQGDFVGEYRSIRYAVEVFYSPEDFYRWPDHESRRKDLIRYYIDRAAEKRSQVDSSIENEKCKKGVLVLVLDSNPAKALIGRQGYLDVLKRVYHELSWGPDYHYGIITGMVSGEGLDDVLYPDL